ncbi:MAG: hypothetical protein BWX99_02264 [Deltaproteobacteria bacterium ADurb.Bin151]|nr:MAG: hypothetical protein BWX99_02264 [Deltaproteobacteria bacterium ADurb.Bin151]
MRHIIDDLEFHWYIFRGLTNETGNRLRHDTFFLCSGTAFNQHFQVEFFRCKALKRILADQAETFFIHIFQ